MTSVSITSPNPSSFGFPSATPSAPLSLGGPFTFPSSSVRPSASSSIFAGNQPTPTRVSSIPSGFRTDESTELLWIEQTTNASAYLAAIAWGLLFGVFYKAIQNILKNKNRTNLLWLPFVGVLFAAATVSMCLFANFNERAWLDNRNYPGGPLYFINEQKQTPVYVAAVVVSFIVQLLGQGFLTYRAHALFNKIWITVPLALWALADFGVGIAFAVTLADSNVNWRPGSELYPVSLNAQAIELSMAFNVVVTALLLWRICYLAPKVPTSFPAHIRSKFVRLDAIMVESVLFLGVISLVYVCLFGEGSTGSLLFFPFIVQLEAIFPTLIVIRIVQGWAWDGGVIHRTPTNYEHSYARGAAIYKADNASDITRVPPGAHHDVVEKA